jgi:manganese peroxidase
MHFSKPFALVAMAASSVQAFNLVPRQNGTGADATAASTPGACPPVWSSISQELTAIFVAGGQCTDDARAAIRAVFHDCFPQGGCDGSLAIPAELERPDNVPMTATVNKLKALATQYNVGVADILMFAGCKQGILFDQRHPG